MLMRLFQFKTKTSEIENLKKFYNNTALPGFQQLRGCFFAGLISGEPNENEFVSVSFWDSRESAENFEKSKELEDLLAQIKPMLIESSEWALQLSDKMELEYAPVMEQPVVKKYAVKFPKGQNLSLKDNEMHIRIVSLNIQQDKIDEFKDIYFRQVVPVLKEIEGCRYIFLTENINELNEFISVTIWDNKINADQHELSGKFTELISLFKHTLSHFVLWKMTLEKEFSAKIKTSDDIRIDSYNLISGKNFK